ncbi:hypothetical protein [Methylorubrum aminovorans]|uniref:hypothetical protein n=1 Tax=Methylorubrum aminovorans TaxID=269069 RepID=UPI003C2D105E
MSEEIIRLMLRQARLSMPQDYGRWEMKVDDCNVRIRFAYKADCDKFLKVFEKKLNDLFQSFSLVLLEDFECPSLPNRKERYLRATSDFPSDDLMAYHLP